METATNDKVFLTAGEAADVLRVSRSWIFKLVSARDIPFVRLGRRVLFDRAELVAWAKSRRVATVREQVAR